MSSSKLTVVLSQAQGKHPAKRALEESIAAALILEPGIDVSIVPHLYDLDPEHTGRLYLESITGDMVLLSWMYPRAAFWVLDRDGIRGQWGETQIKSAAMEDDEADEEETESEPTKGIGSLNVPDRSIYCLDLRDAASHETYVAEVRRIAGACRSRGEAKLKEWVQGNPTMVQLGRYLHPEESTAKPKEITDAPDRRWYP